MSPLGSNSLDAACFLAAAAGGPLPVSRAELISCLVQRLQVSETDLTPFDNGELGHIVERLACCDKSNLVEEYSKSWPTLEEGDYVRWEKLGLRLGVRPLTLRCFLSPDDRSFLEILLAWSATPKEPSLVTRAGHIDHLAKRLHVFEAALNPLSDEQLTHLIDRLAACDRSGPIEEDDLEGLDGDFYRWKNLAMRLNINHNILRHFLSPGDRTLLETLLLDRTATVINLTLRLRVSTISLETLRNDQLARLADSLTHYEAAKCFERCDEQDGSFSDDRLKKLAKDLGMYASFTHRFLSLGDVSLLETLIAEDTRQAEAAKIKLAAFLCEFPTV